MPVSLLDLVVIGIVLISAVLAMMRGFTREVLAIASWGAAALAAWVLHPQVLPYVSQHIGNKQIALAAAIGGVFLVTLIVVSLITVRISDFILDSKIGALDRTLGFVFGAARGVLLCVVGYIFFSWLVPDKMQPEWVRTSKARPFLESSGETIKSYLPDDPEALLKKIKKPKDGDAPQDADQPQKRSDASPPATQNQVAVQTGDKAKLNALVESATPVRR